MPRFFSFNNNGNNILQKSCYLSDKDTYLLFTTQKNLGGRDAADLWRCGIGSFITCLPKRFRFY